MTLNEVPIDLSSLQYARFIIEETLGMPVKGNLEVVGDSITAISKTKLFRGRAQALRDAFFWLNRRCEVAKENGAKINNLWFVSGEYNYVERPSPTPKAIRYEHHGEGYGEGDIKFLCHRMIQEMSAKRAVDPEALLSELDEKRPGGAPAWRR